MALPNTNSHACLSVSGRSRSGNSSTANTYATDRSTGHTAGLRVSFYSGPLDGVTQIAEESC